jgi:isopenicillin N synthase-like dioxygenase
MTAAMPVNGIPHRGYSFLGQENISGITGFADSLSGGLPLVDVKETFDLGSPEDSEAANRWPRPSALPKFRRVLEEQYVALEGVHEMILEALALALDIPSDTFTSLCGKSHHELRLLHYPSTTARNLKSGQTRIADHTDFGAVTLLFQDSTGGLEGRHPDSAEYRAVQSNQEECLVMLGDCFQRWTGAYFWALPHRVTLPFRSRVDDDEAILAERYSIAFFGKPDRSSKVGNLEDLRIQQQVHYESITAGEYNLMKVRKTYK